jgi:hypothetical protein
MIPARPQLIVGHSDAARFELARKVAIALIEREAR